VFEVENSKGKESIFAFSYLSEKIKTEKVFGIPNFYATAIQLPTIFSEIIF